jgi:hypothetical protein
MPAITDPVATSDAPMSARELVEEASQMLEAACAPDSDHRNSILFAIENNWDAPEDDRWSAAEMLVRHDNYPRYVVLTEALGLLVQIVGQVEDMAAALGEHPREDLTATGTELRAATERLHAIVDAVTAVHVL